LQSVFYTDAQTTQDKPEMIRRDSVSRAILKSLQSFDDASDVISVCGTAYPIGEFYVCPVIQLPKATLEDYPGLKKDVTFQDQSVESHFLMRTLKEIAKTATFALAQPDPGRGLSNQSMKSPEEILSAAASSFMHVPGLAAGVQTFHYDLFERFNAISALNYEGKEGNGHLLLVALGNSSLTYDLKLEQPVSFSDERWVRKLLQMASSDMWLIADCERIYGLGRLDSSHNAQDENTFEIVFRGHYKWDLLCNQQILLQSRFGRPTLPKPFLQKEQFFENYLRIFSSSNEANAAHIWKLVIEAAGLNHGCVIVIADDAETEAIRLSNQGSRIEPASMNESLLRRVSSIDGAILLDPQGTCHAVGVILDGLANRNCTPARGARFNSAVRYVGGASNGRLAIVGSDDHTVDMIPQWRQRIERSKLEKMIQTLEESTRSNCHGPQMWLEEHSFYLNQDQCDRVNSALDRIMNEKDTAPSMMSSPINFALIQIWIAVTSLTTTRRVPPLPPPQQTGYPRNTRPQRGRTGASHFPH
ncbi:MAG: diadenylate cyclase, partial [Chrysiogenetes bacterium]|nr:diadenylate cyclase [Chrysiogenetes bacterium]